MKDAYSFDRDNEGLDRSYEKMYEAYCRVFPDAVWTIGWLKPTPEQLAEARTMSLWLCRRLAKMPWFSATRVDMRLTLSALNRLSRQRGLLTTEKVRTGIRKISTPGMRTIEEVTGYLKVEPRVLLKTLVYVADGTPVAAIVRGGDRDLNEAKLKRVLCCRELELATPEVIERVSGAPVGFTGPVGLRERIKIVGRLGGNCCWRMPWLGGPMLSMRTW